MPLALTGREVEKFAKRLTRAAERDAKLTPPRRLHFCQIPESIENQGLAKTPPPPLRARCER